MTLAERDFNHELLKTKGLAWALVSSADSILTESNLMKDPEDGRVVGLRHAIEILADRLDDLCQMNERETAEVFRLRREASGG